MRSEGFLQSLPLMCPKLASQNADGAPQKGGAGKYKSCHFLRWCSSIPSTCLCQVKVGPFTKDKKGISWKDYYYYCCYYYYLLTVLQQLGLFIVSLLWECWHWRMLFWKYIYIKRRQTLSTILLPHLVISSLVNPLGKQREVSGITAAGPAEAAVLSCLLTESRLGWLGCHGAVEASPCSCPDLPPWNMLYVRSRAVNKWCLPGAGDSRAAQCLLLSFLNFLGHGSPCVHVFINSPLPVHNPWGGLSFPLFTRERLANSWGDSSRQEEDFETTRVLHWKGN